MNKKGNVFEGILIFILVIGVLFEVVLLFIAWQYADEVKCNLLCCEFTKTEVVQITDYNTKTIYDIEVDIPSEDFVGVIYNSSDIYCLQNKTEINCYQRVSYTK